MNNLAQPVTQWNGACDKRLARLIGYEQNSAHFEQYCHVGSTASCWKLGLFHDADFAGNLADSKSASGGVLCILGSLTFVPTSWVCVKHDPRHVCVDPFSVRAAVLLRRSTCCGQFLCLWEHYGRYRGDSSTQSCVRSSSRPTSTLLLPDSLASSVPLQSHFLLTRSRSSSHTLRVIIQVTSSMSYP